MVLYSNEFLFGFHATQFFTQTPGKSSLLLFDTRSLSAKFIECYSTERSVEHVGLDADNLDYYGPLL